MSQVQVETLSTIGLESYLTIGRWLREKADKTRVNYLRHMQSFVEKTGYNPDQFLAWAKTVESVEVQDLIDKSADGFTDSVRRNMRGDIRSFLRHNGFNNLPRTNLNYTLKDWHRGYRKEEIRSLLSYLDNLQHKLFVYVAIETGLRANTVLALRYKHIKEDFEAGITPCAIRLGPEFYGKKKSAGFTFLGERSVAILKKAIEAGLVKTKPDSPLIPVGYYGIYDAVDRARASGKADIDPKVQPFHGMRKFFEAGLDAGRIDEDKKQLIEGHFAGVRAKHYTDRDWDILRGLYRECYPYIDVDAGSVEVAQKIQSSEDKILSLERKVADLTATLQRLLEKERGH